MQISRSPRPRLVVALSAAVLLAILAPTAPARSARAAVARASAGCPGAGDVTPSPRHMIRALACLHNRERRRHGLRAVHWDHALAAAAAGHDRDMVRRHYFDHRSPDGASPLRRAARAGYARGARCWAAGENLLYSPQRRSASQLFAAWMGSDVHRHNILAPRWHELGLGVVMATPFGGGGITLVAEFGARGGCR